MIHLRWLRPLSLTLSFALAFAVSGCVSASRGPAAPPKPVSGTDVVQRMLSRYEGTWFRTMQFTQENTRFLANGRTDRSQWKGFMLLPGRLRIEFQPASGNNGAVYADGNVYSFEGGRLSRTTPQLNILLVLTADVYAQPLANTVRQLTTLGVDLARFRADTFAGRPVWVVGGTGPKDLASSQVWVDAQSWVALRVIDRPAQGTGATAARPSTEYRLGDYRVIDGVPLVHEIIFLRDGRQFFREQYTEVQLNTPMDARLFSSLQWKAAGRTP